MGGLGQMHGTTYVHNYCDREGKSDKGKLAKNSVTCLQEECAREIHSMGKKVKYPT